MVALMLLADIGKIHPHHVAEQFWSMQGWRTSSSSSRAQALFH
jgi:hypothetical protein